jgi:short-subunit dehydrogenase
MSTTPIALITGASSGIGVHLAEQYAADGIPLLLVARRQAELEQVAASLRQRFKVPVEIYAADLGVADAVPTLVAEVERRGLKVGHLVNNAGFGLFGHVQDNDPQRQVALIQLNVTALMLLTRAFLPDLIRVKGSLLNVASTAAFQPMPWMAVYGGSKAFVLSFTEAIAQETLGTGLRVSCLCPGATETPFHAVAGSEGSKMHHNKMPSAAWVAQVGYRGMQRGKVVVVPAFGDWALTQLVRVLPRWMVRRIVNSVMGEQK